MYVVLCGYCVAGTSEQEEWIGTVNTEYAIIYTVEEVYSFTRGKYSYDTHD